MRDQHSIITCTTSILCLHLFKLILLCHLPLLLQDQPALNTIKSQCPAASKSQPFPPPHSPSPKYINSFAQLDQDEDSDYEPLAPVNKGKQKEGGAGPKKPRIRVIDKILPDTPPAGESEKRRAVPEKTEVSRVLACERCHNTKKPCFKQKGSSIACYNCAKLKMKCIPQSDEGHHPPAPSVTLIPAK